MTSSRWRISKGRLCRRTGDTSNFAVEMTRAGGMAGCQPPALRLFAHPPVRSTTAQDGKVWPTGGGGPTIPPSRPTRSQRQSDEWRGPTGATSVALQPSAVPPLGPPQRPQGGGVQGPNRPGRRWTGHRRRADLVGGERGKSGQWRKTLGVRGDDYGTRTSGDGVKRYFWLSL
jgi:hypothetical protein